MPVDEIARRYGPRVPAKTSAIALLLTSLGAIGHWLSEIVPAQLAGRTPQAIRDAGLLTDAAAVLDLSFMAPAATIAAILLLKRKPLGFVLAPVLLAFLVLSGLGLAAIGAAMALRGIKTDFALFPIALGIAAGSAVLVALCMRETNSTRPENECVAHRKVGE